MSAPKTGRRVQIYLPSDLLAQWDATPRYERSAMVATALRRHWEVRESDHRGKDRGKSPDGGKREDAP